MLTRTVITIHIREGVTARLLLTPALYGVARERGIDLFPQESPNQDKETRFVSQYTKLAYCAAISAWEVEAVDDPDKGDFPWKYEDFLLWAYDNPRELGKTVDAILQALTGKSARDYAREAAQKEAEDEKKKQRRKRPFLWITGRSKPSS